MGIAPFAAEGLEFSPPIHYGYSFFSGGAGARRKYLGEFQRSEREASSMRDKILLECTECKKMRYPTTKNKRNTFIDRC